VPIHGLLGVEDGGRGQAPEEGQEGKARTPHGGGGLAQLLGHSKRRASIGSREAALRAG
jgi:hypothetical protein